jgi:hypothetical protein
MTTAKPDPHIHFSLAGIFFTGTTDRNITPQYRGVCSLTFYHKERRHTRVVSDSPGGGRTCDPCYPTVRLVHDPSRGRLGTGFGRDFQSRPLRPDKDTLAFHLGGVNVAALLADEFR